MFRQRTIASIAYAAGQVTRARLPNDAVYHQLQFAIQGGVVTSVFGLAPTGPIFESTFPFSLIRDMRVIRNGSDVVWQGSGAQLAAEHHYLNNAPPQARLYNTTSNVETLLTGTSRGVTIPANSSGIAANVLEFVGASTASVTQTSCQFDLQMEMWFQLNLSSDAWACNTLVDARKLATFDIEITWADPTSVIIPGTNNTSNTIACTLNILSTDQDNVSTKSNFGTFKRSAFQYSSNPYGSSNQQIMLSRGNFWYGMIMQTRAYKTGSTTILRPENNVLGSVQNRLNTNFQLRVADFVQMQAKNISDNGGRQSPYGVAGGAKQGFAAIEYTAQLDNPGELIATYVTDVFDLLLTYQAIGAATNGITTPSTNPVLDILTQEVIPGVSVGADAPQGAINGSIVGTSAKPYSR
jgi:hypothetical protein